MKLSFRDGFIEIVRFQIEINKFHLPFAIILIILTNISCFAQILNLLLLIQSYGKKRWGKDCLTFSIELKICRCRVISYNHVYRLNWTEGINSKGSMRIFAIFLSMI